MKRGLAIAQVLFFALVMLLIGVCLAAWACSNLGLSKQAAMGMQGEELARGAVARVTQYIEQQDQSAPGLSLVAALPPPVDLSKLQLPAELAACTLVLDPTSGSIYTTNNLESDLPARGFRDAADQASVPPFTLDLIVKVSLGSEAQYYEAVLRRTWPFALYADGAQAHLVRTQVCGNVYGVSCSGPGIKVLKKSRVTGDADSTAPVVVDCNSSVLGRTRTIKPYSGFLQQLTLPSSCGYQPFPTCALQPFYPFPQACACVVGGLSLAQGSYYLVPESYYVEQGTANGKRSGMAASMSCYYLLQGCVSLQPGRYFFHGSILNKALVATPGNSHCVPLPGVCCPPPCPCPPQPCTTPAPSPQASPTPQHGTGNHSYSGDGDPNYDPDCVRLVQGGCGNCGTCHCHCHCHCMCPPPPSSCGTPKCGPPPGYVIPTGLTVKQSTIRKGGHLTLCKSTVYVDGNLDLAAISGSGTLLVGKVLTIDGGTLDSEDSGMVIQASGIYLSASGRFNGLIIATGPIVTTPAADRLQVRGAMLGEGPGDLFGVPGLSDVLINDVNITFDAAYTRLINRFGAVRTIAFSRVY